MKVFDLFTFAGEYDLLEIRFNILKDYVDKFVIGESMETFSGNIKPLYWVERDKDRFEEWEDKVIHNVVTSYDDPEILTQLETRPYVDQRAFVIAFYQKEMLRKTLETLNPRDEDIVIYGDADEIVNPEILKNVDNKVHKLRQLAYSYYLNNRSNEDWRGTIVTKYKNLKGNCLNDMRANPIEADILENGGWHFTNLGGFEAIKKKIESYDHQEVNIPWVIEGLAERMELNVDFLGRGYTMQKDESQLPQYLLDNKSRYKHLWKS